MRVETIDEAVAVGAVFNGRDIKPRWFLWQGKKHEVQKVNMVWRSREGEVPLLFFSVSHNDDTYELRLNQKSLEWRLIKMALEE